MPVQIEIRGKMLDFEEITEVRAVRADRIISDSREAVATMRDLRTASRDVAEQVIEEAPRQVFESAGWVFARDQENTLAAARLLTREPPQSIVRRVFRNAAGDVFIESSQLTVRFKPRKQMAAILNALRDRGLRMKRSLGFAKNLFEVSVDSGESLEAARNMGRVAGVEYAEPQLIQHLGGRLRPGDPRYALQWQWNNNGSSGGIAAADVRAENAWNSTLGRLVRVAVIDNGMDVTHPDLQAALQGGGHFEDSSAGSAVFIPLQAGGPSFPPSDHGTFCMGMVGARLNNNEGGVGGAPECTLIPIACAPDQVSTQTTLARAVAYAADPSREDGNASSDQGADVIACSLGPNGADWDMESVLQDAIDFAVQSGRSGNGCPIFWAVSNGNHPVSRDEVCSYEHTIGVGRSTRMDLEDGSAFGPELDFLAPGVEVYSTRQGGGYGFWTGTSFAAPCAASVGALALAVRPNQTWEAVRDRLRETCDKIGPDAYAGNQFGGRNDRYGYGRVNAENAVR